MWIAFVSFLPPAESFSAEVPTRMGKILVELRYRHSGEVLLRSCTKVHYIFCFPLFLRSSRRSSPLI